MGRNLEKLQKAAMAHLEAGETIDAAVLGAYETKILGADSARKGILLATDRRLVFYAKKIMGGYETEVFPYSNISSIEMGKGLMGHSLALFASGNKIKVKWINDGDINWLVDVVKARIGKKEAAPAAPSPTEDPMEMLQKLADLRDKGILSSEEFDAKKKEILSRL